MTGLGNARGVPLCPWGNGGVIVPRAALGAISRAVEEVAHVLGQTHFGQLQTLIPPTQAHEARVRDLREEQPVVFLGELEVTLPDLPAIGIGEEAIAQARFDDIAPADGHGRHVNEFPALFHFRDLPGRVEKKDTILYRIAHDATRN